MPAFSEPVEQHHRKHSSNYAVNVGPEIYAHCPSFTVANWYLAAHIFFDCFVGRGREGEGVVMRFSLHSSSVVSRGHGIRQNSVDRSSCRFRRSLGSRMFGRASSSTSFMYATEAPPRRLRSQLQRERDNSQRDIDLAPKFGIECWLQCPCPNCVRNILAVEWSFLC